MNTSYALLERTNRRYYEKTGNPVHAFHMLRWALKARQTPPQWCVGVVGPALDRLMSLVNASSIKDADIVRALGLKPGTGHRSPLTEAGRELRGATVAQYVSGSTKYVRKAAMRLFIADAPDWNDDYENQVQQLARSLRRGRNLLSDGRAKAAKRRKAPKRRK